MNEKCSHCNVSFELEESSVAFFLVGKAVSKNKDGNNMGTASAATQLCFGLLGSVTLMRPQQSKLTHTEVKRIRLDSCICKPLVLMEN